MLLGQTRKCPLHSYFLVRVARDDQQVERENWQQSHGHLDRWRGIISEILFWKHGMTETRTELRISVTM